jgi:hypothetical protein
MDTYIKAGQGNSSFISLNQGNKRHSMLQFKQEFSIEKLKSIHQKFEKYLRDNSEPG